MIPPSVPPVELRPWLAVSVILRDRTDLSDDEVARFPAFYKAVLDVAHDVAESGAACVYLFRVYADADGVVRDDLPCVTERIVKDEDARSGVHRDEVAGGRNPYGRDSRVLASSSTGLDGMCLVNVHAVEDADPPETTEDGVPVQVVSGKDDAGLPERVRARIEARYRENLAERKAPRKRGRKVKLPL